LLVDRCADNLLQSDLALINQNINRKTSYFSDTACILPDSFHVWDIQPEYIKKYTRRRIKSIRNILLLPSIKNIPLSRIEKVFKGWRRDSNKYYYLHELYYHTYYSVDYDNPEDSDKPTRKEFRPVVSTSSELIFLDNIHSREELEFSINNLIEKILETRHTIVVPDP
jgi:hypothetical protein